MMFRARCSRRQKKKKKKSKGAKRSTSWIVRMLLSIPFQSQGYSHIEEAAPLTRPDIKPATVFFRPPVFLAQALAKHSGRRPAARRTERSCQDAQLSCETLKEKESMHVL